MNFPGYVKFSGNRIIFIIKTNYLYLIYMDLQSIKPLQERAKELQCLYEVENILKQNKTNYTEAFNEIVRVIPHGWQFPESCHAVICYEDKKYFFKESEETDTNQSAELIVDNSLKGRIIVFYKNLSNRNNAFLPEEKKLLNTIANQISQFIFYDKLEKTIDLLSEEVESKGKRNLLDNNKDEFWRWRFKMAQKIVDTTDFEYYGIRAIYLIGSTKEATAGPASDIDLLVHFTGDELQEKLLKAWIKGWSFALNEHNYEKTGYEDENGLIDLHIITDDDIKNKTSFAVLIGNIHNPARLLKKNE